VELLHGGVRGAELEKREQSSPKHPLTRRGAPQAREPLKRTQDHQSIKLIANQKSHQAVCQCHRESYK
jgi:hypothetical protein